MSVREFGLYQLPKEILFERMSEQERIGTWNKTARDNKDPFFFWMNQDISFVFEDTQNPGDLAFMEAVNSFEPFNEHPDCKKNIQSFYAENKEMVDHAWRLWKRFTDKDSMVMMSVNQVWKDSQLMRAYDHIEYAKKIFAMKLPDSPEMEFPSKYIFSPVFELPESVWFHKISNDEKIDVLQKVFPKEPVESVWKSSGVADLHAAITTVYNYIKGKLPKITKENGFGDVLLTNRSLIK